MIDQTIIDTAKQVNLINLIGQSTELRKVSSGEYEGPCAKCGGTDRLHVKQTSWFCRQCHPEWGDSIEYMQWARGLDFAGAVAALTGGLPATPVIKQEWVKSTRERPSPVKPAQPANWLDKVAPMVAMAQERIYDAYDYLESRGLDAMTAVTFGLGYRPDAPLPGTWDAKRRCSIMEPQPAVVMPWMRGGRVVAVRYRFLESHRYKDTNGKERTVKQSSIAGSEFSGILYGGHVLPEFCSMPVDGKCAESLRTLALCEGEMNAMSIWQVAQRWRWDVLSLGSESQKPTEAAINFAGRYGRVIVWMDKGAVARQLMSMIPGATAVHSPVVEGKAMDANDLLQSGQLGEFLREVRFRSCQSDAERERVKWDFSEVGL